jgi:hypothetical protein
MLATTMAETGLRIPSCNCGNEAKIIMHGYAHDGDNFLCVDCALQLVRKITEDLCEVLTVRGRHG